MSTDNNESAKKVVRSDKFAECVATNFGLRVNSNLCEIGFAYETALAEEEVLMEVGKVILTPLSLKILSFLLVQGLAAFESEQGEIPLDAKRLEKITNAVKRSIKKKEAAN